MASNSHYQSVDADGYRPYTFADEKPRSNRKKWIIIGTVVALLGLIAIGVGVGVTLSRNNNNSGSNNSSSNNSNSSSDAEGPEQTDPNDPSTFIKDPNLHQSFYALAYTPENSQIDIGCNNSIAAVIKDVQIMSQLTKRIRLYGADCDQSALVLEAIKQTKVDMEVFLGNYPIPDDNTPYERQRDAIKAALEKYGADHVAGITVGNEFMLNYVVGHGSDDPNSDIGNTGAAILLANIADTRQMLAGLNLGKNIPVGNSDAGSYFNTRVLEASDYGMANVHPWFAHVTAENAAAWTTNFFDETNVRPAALLVNQPKMYIAETGWPTASKDAEHETNGAGTASEGGLQTFLDTFVCNANQNGVGYFYFEFSDEKWKDDKFGGVEGHWGLFNQNRTLKNIKLPECSSP